MLILVILILLVFPTWSIAVDYSEIANSVEQLQKEKEKIEQEKISYAQKKFKEEGGYGATVRSLRRIKEQGEYIPFFGCTARRLRNTLEMQYAWAGVLPEDRQVLNQAFAQDYPGSVFDCISKTGRVVSGHLEYVLQNGRVVRFIQNGPVTYNIFWESDFANVLVSDGKQSINFIVDIKNPQKSYFNDASLSITAQTQREGKYEGEAKPQGLSLSKNQLIEILNSYYAQHNQNGDMLSFASTLILDARFREHIFSEIVGELK